MPNMIHARRVKGRIRYRIWSTVTDSYITEELTKQELKEYLQEEAVQEALAKVQRDFKQRIARAIQNGTSGLYENPCGLDELWVKERKT